MLLEVFFITMSSSSSSCNRPIVMLTADADYISDLVSLPLCILSI